jgi:hypothetical protein
MNTGLHAAAHEVYLVLGISFKTSQCSARIHKVSYATPVIAQVAYNDERLMWHGPNLRPSWQVGGFKQGHDRRAVN